jgi:hypothetical protein
VNRLLNGTTGSDQPAHPNYGWQETLMADTHENKKYDIPAKPSAGVSDPKGKHAQLDKHPRKGRERAPSTQDEVQDATETKTSEKVRVEQGGKNHRSNTN